jgi:hypothetical protein
MPPTQKMLHAHAMAADAIRWPRQHAQPMAGFVPVEETHEITVTEEMIDAGRHAYNDCADRDTGAVVMVQAVYRAMRVMEPEDVFASASQQVAQFQAERDLAIAGCQALRATLTASETERAAAWGKWITLAAQHESACDLIKWQQARIAQLEPKLSAPEECPVLRATRSGNRQIIGIPLP